MADRSSPRGGTVPNLRLGTNVAVFLLCFGVSTLEAFQTRNWLKARLGLAIGVVFLSADNPKRRPEPDIDLPLVPDRQVVERP